MTTGTIDKPVREFAAGDYTFRELDDDQVLEIRKGRSDLYYSVYFCPGLDERTVHFIPKADPRTICAVRCGDGGDISAVYDFRFADSVFAVNGDNGDTLVRAEGQTVFDCLREEYGERSD